MPWRRITCFFGVHSWRYYFPWPDKPHVKGRDCPYCGKVQYRTPTHPTWLTVGE